MSDVELFDKRFFSYSYITVTQIFDCAEKEKSKMR